MRGTWLLAAAMLLPAGLMAQNALPDGTILPISLNKGLSAIHVHAGQEIHATVMQDIPGTQVRRGDEVLGRVSQVHASKNGPVKLELCFGAVVVRGQRIPLKTDLRALASPSDLEDAQTAMYGPDSGIGFDAVSTNQIGGDLVFHGGGPVFMGSQQIGKSTSDGILVQPRAALGERCRGALSDNKQPQALWLFSSDACGVYGFNNIEITHAGRTDPQGNITLTTQSGNLNLFSQSGLLLRVQGS
jgi:hypothetical protein